MAGDRDAQLEALNTAFNELLVAQRRLRGRDALPGRGVSFPQFRLLRELEAGELPASQLAAAAELAPASVTQMIDLLAAAGLVERTRSQQDRRVVTVRLTDEGRRRVAERKQQHERIWREIMADLDTDTLAHGVVVLQRLARLYDAL